MKVLSTFLLILFPGFGAYGYTSQLPIGDMSSDLVSTVHNDAAETERLPISTTNLPSITTPQHILSMVSTIEPLLKNTITVSTDVMATSVTRSPVVPNPNQEMKKETLIDTEPELDNTFPIQDTDKTEVIPPNEATQVLTSKAPITIDPSTAQVPTTTNLEAITTTITAATTTTTTTAATTTTTTTAATKSPVTTTSTSTTKIPITKGRTSGEADLPHDENKSLATTVQTSSLFVIFLIIFVFI